MRETELILAAPSREGFAEGSSTMTITKHALIFSLVIFVGCETAPVPPDPESNALESGTTYNGSGDNNTQSPVKHVIVIIGENRTFDHVFATYQPLGGQHVDNLLSKGIIKADGTPGPNFSRAAQDSAVDSNPPGTSPPLADPLAAGWQLSPGQKTAYTTLPPPGVGGPENPYISSVTEAAQAENGLEPEDLVLLTTGGTGIMGTHVPDTRIPLVNSLPPGPFQLTPGVPYDAYAASPVHRFYQMWQQLDCNALYATTSNPSGCLGDLFSWVETSVGAGTNGLPQPANFNGLTTGEGSTALGFYNVQEGDAPYLKMVADTYAMSDNYHQAVEGGTGANHVMLGTGDAVYYSDGQGNAMTPPANEIENPNPQPGTNNWYTEDGYGSANEMGAPIGGGSYSDCSDSDQPGVGSVISYLASLPTLVDPRCVPGHYFLLNNYAPGYFGDGTVNTGAANPFTVPPSTIPTIGDQLRSKDVSFAYFGDQFNLYLQDPNFANPADNYCDICNFFQYSSGIMTNPTARQQHLKDTTDLYAGIASGQLPAVSFVKPSGLVDGHPASSKLDLFEAFTKKIVDLVKGKPDLWKDTAIIVTFDEGGGYYDSGYVQPVDFFGDGTRLPLLVISPLATGGRVSHEYADHVSLLKFIERNWQLSTVSKRSRDNLPNPVQTGSNPYVPMNSPAIGDLFDLFNFAH
jgi:phospholipase C